MKCELIAHRDMQGGEESYGVLTDAKNWIFWKWDGEHFCRSKSFSLELESDKILGILLHLVKRAHEVQTKLKEDQPVGIRQPPTISKDEVKRKLNFPEKEGDEESSSNDRDNFSAKTSPQKQKRGKKKSTSPLDIPSTPDAKRIKSRQKMTQKETESGTRSSSPSEDSDDTFVKDTSPQAPEMLPVRSISKKEKKS